MQKLLKTYKSSEGFTLIELLVVIAIIGVLMVGTLVALNPAAQINKSKDATAKGKLDQVSSAVNSYYLSNNSLYPTASSALTSSGDLSSMPSGITYTAYPSGCNNTTTNCTGATVSYTLLYNDGTNTIWCWRSSTGTATAASACSTP